MIQKNKTKVLVEDQVSEASRVPRARAKLPPCISVGRLASFQRADSTNSPKTSSPFRSDIKSNTDNVFIPQINKKIQSDSLLLNVHKVVDQIDDEATRLSLRLD